MFVEFALPLTFLLFDFIWDRRKCVQEKAAFHAAFSICTQRKKGSGGCFFKIF